MIDTVEVMGVRITNASMEEFDGIILDVIHRGEKKVVLAVNVHTMNLIWRLPWLQQIYRAAPFVHCDGDGVRWAALIFGRRIKQKITFAEWIWHLAELSQREGLRWYLIGARRETIDKAVQVLNEKYPRLEIVGHRDGFFRGEDDVRKTERDISAKKPHLLIVGMGQPLQEQWLSSSLDALEFNIGLGAGAVFEYVSGNARLTPPAFSALGLEWLFRFLQEPRRLFRRYFLGNPLFFARSIAVRTGLRRQVWWERFEQRGRA